MNSQATEFSYSGFATLGYAQSDKDYAYQRFITKEGSFKRDSLLGLQANARFSPQWSATVQGVVAMPQDNDERYELLTRWAFLAYRPNNDWLIRLGKLRLGILMNLQNMEVGTSYAFARLPVEVYGRLPTYDFVGANVTKTWRGEDYDIELEVSTGESDSTFRVYSENDLSLLDPLKYGHLSYINQIYFLPTKVNAKGAGLTLTGLSDKYHAAIYDLDVTEKVLGDFSYRLSSVGFEHTWQSWLLTGEYLRIETLKDHNLDHNAYIMLKKRIDRWAPYIAYVDKWTDYGVDQKTYSLGLNYIIDPKQRIKAEISKVAIGNKAEDTLVDANVRQTDIQVYSLSYNLAF